MKFLLIIFISIFSISAFSQNKRSLRDLNIILSQQAKIIAKCEKQTRESQIKEFGRVLPKIAGECEWSSNGCPIRIVKPIYPNSARKSGISGTVKIEIIIDEEGKTIYSKAVKGKKIFYQNAERAASLSLYKPKIVCGKAVMQKKYIFYNFIPD